MIADFFFFFFCNSKSLQESIGLGTEVPIIFLHIGCIPQIHILFLFFLFIFFLFVNI